MRSQLTLIDTPLDTTATTSATNPTRGRRATPLHTVPGMSRFRLDDQTRAIGREGLAAARAALDEAAARRKAADDMLADRHAA
jgi:hypothetical protein